MRMTQWIGLSKRALCWLNDNVRTQDIITLTKEEVTFNDDGTYVVRGKPVREQVVWVTCDGKYTAHGMYDEETNLSGYILKDGSKVFEQEQCAPWSSGPCILTHLVREDGSVIEDLSWTDEEIEEEIY